MASVGVYSVSLGFLSSSSLAEARVLLWGMRVARERHGASASRARTDAAEVVEIVNERRKPHDPALRAAIEQIGAERSLFECFELKWSRSTNASERQPGVPYGRCARPEGGRAPGPSRLQTRGSALEP